MFRLFLGQGDSQLIGPLEFKMFAKSRPNLMIPAHQLQDAMTERVMGAKV
jgi:hypothetical protein